MSEKKCKNCGAGVEAVLSAHYDADKDTTKILCYRCIEKVIKGQPSEPPTTEIEPSRIEVYEKYNYSKDSKSLLGELEKREEVQPFLNKIGYARNGVVLEELYSKKQFQSLLSQVEYYKRNYVRQAKLASELMLKSHDFEMKSNSLEAKLGVAVELLRENVYGCDEHGIIVCDYCHMKMNDEHNDSCEYNNFLTSLQEPKDESGK